MSKLRLVESIGTGAIQRESDGTYKIALITPGQGSSGYYREEVIREYAPVAFPKGTHVYLDHLQEGETRTPAKLLGYLTEETVVDGEGVAVNRFKPLKKHAEWIEEVRELVGFSVSVRGTATEGEIDGKKTPIVESLEPHVTNTVDIVSYAGRGGKFLESFVEEANRAEERTQTESSAGTTEGNESMLTDEQIATLGAAIATALAPKFEALEAAVAPAKDEVTPDEDRVKAIEATRAVESADISASVKESLLEGIKAGNYDVEAEIAKDKALREEIRAELMESIENGVGASAFNEAHEDDYKVKGWSA